MGNNLGNPGLDVATEVAMLFFYLPMIIFGAMFEANADKRVDEFALEQAKAPARRGVPESKA
jgi:hypothetical protein